MPIAIIIIGSSIWLTFIVRAYTIANKVDNWQLVNSYTASAMIGLWIMAFGGLWLLLRKR
jgi:hypothetical protein